MYKDYIAPKYEMPITTKRFKPDPGHKLHVMHFIDNLEIPYLKKLDNSIDYAMQTGTDKFIIVGGRQVNAVKAAIYMHGRLNDVFMQTVSDDFFDEDSTNSCPDDNGIEKDSIEDDCDYIDVDDFDNEIDEPEEDERAIKVSTVEEINLKTISEDERKQGRQYEVRHLINKSVAAILVTGLEDGCDLEEKIEAIKEAEGCVFVWIPESLKNNRCVYELELMEGYQTVTLTDPNNEYYAGVLSKLSAVTGTLFDDDLSELDVVLRLRKRLGDNLKEESIDRALQRAISTAIRRGEKNNTVVATDFFPEFNQNETAVQRLNSLTGLENVKMVVKERMALGKEMQRNKKLSKVAAATHLIFCGNPGTGKTTVAELLANCLMEVGASNGNYVSVARQDLVGKYVGHSAPKVADAFKRAHGGVLFVDEAGFFLNRDSGGFVGEVLKEFVRYMELDHSVTVIFGMYSSEAEEFLKLDTGIRSRIAQVVKFEDYSNEEIKQIAKSMFSNRGYTMGRGVADLIADYTEKLRQREDYGNARDVRRVCDCAVTAHSIRIHIDNAAKSSKKNDANVISTADVRRGIEIASRTPKDDKPKRRIGFVCAPNACQAQ